MNAFAAKYKARYGFDVNFLGETGYTAAQFVLAVLDKAGRNLTLDNFIDALESMRDYHDIFGSPPLTITPTNHHAANQYIPDRGTQRALGASGARTARLLICFSETDHDRRPSLQSHA